LRKQLEKKNHGSKLRVREKVEVKESFEIEIDEEYVEKRADYVERKR